LLLVLCVLALAIDLTVGFHEKRDDAKCFITLNHSIVVINIVKVFSVTCTGVLCD